MQKTQVVGKFLFPAFFIPIQLGGVALTVLGLLGLNNRLGITDINTLPTLVGTVTGWVLVGLGVIVAIANALRLQRAPVRSHMQEAASPAADLELPVALRPSDELSHRRPTTLLPPRKNRVNAALAGVLGVLVFMGLGATLLSASAITGPESGLAAFALLLMFLALIFCLIACSWIAARVDLHADGVVGFRGLFVRRRYAISEITSVKRNANGSRRFVVVRTASSYFSVSSYSFSLAQLDLIVNFCDPQGSLISPRL